MTMSKKTQALILAAAAVLMYISIFINLVKMS